MEFIKYHDKVTTKEGYTLSVDMVRLVFKFNSTREINELYEQLEFSDIGMHCNIKPDDRDYNRPVILYDCFQRKNRKFGTYRNLFTIYTDESKEYSFALGIGLQNTPDTLKAGFLEFNPNKCAGKVLEWLLNFLAARCKYLKIKRYDLALDVPMRGDLVHVKKDQRKYELHKPNNDAQYDTEYLGVRNTTGRFKKYNKKAEYNQTHQYGKEMTEELTRLELTLDTMDYEQCKKLFPEIEVDTFETINLLDYMEYEKLKDTDRVIVDLLNRLEDLGEKKVFLKRLGRVKAEKLTPFVLNRNRKFIIINEDDFNACMKKLAEYCHLKNLITSKEYVGESTDKQAQDKEQEQGFNSWWYLMTPDGEILDGYDPVKRRWKSKEAKEKYKAVLDWDKTHPSPVGG